MSSWILYRLIIMIEYTLLITTNLIFHSSRTYNTRAIVNKDIFTVLWSSFIVKVSWIISTSIGVKSFLDLDIYLICTYILTGLLGDFIGMKFKYEH